MEKMQNTRKEDNKRLVELVDELRKLEEKEHSIKLKIFELISKGNVKLEEQKNDEKEIRETIAFHLKKIGIPVNVLAYEYLKEGIAMVVENHEEIETVEKFYTLIEEKFSNKVENTRRTIRYAIKVLYDENKNKQELTKYFGEKKPTASQFIKRLVEVVQSELH